MIDWVCHVCGEVRPDDKIAVCTREGRLDSGARLTANVRYCADRPVCRAVAPVIAAAWLSLEPDHKRR